MDSSTVVRGALQWPALTAWGAGLIQLALGAAALTGAQGGAGLFAAGIVLVGLGAAGFAWGGTVLARGRLVVPRAGVAGALAGLLALAVAFAADAARISVIAAATASALLVVTGLACAAASRPSRRRRVDAAPPRGHGTDAARPRVAALLVSAVLVAALVTPALATTEAGQLAPGHAGHGVTVDEHHR